MYRLRAAGSRTQNESVSGVIGCPKKTVGSLGDFV
jgi:hypothetical protein